MKPCTFGRFGLFMALCFVGACSGSGNSFPEPPRIESKNGILHADLTASQESLQVGGTPVSTRVYNKLFVPPTLVLNPGDTMLLHLNNDIDQETNLHYHGMNVSPLSPGDDVFITVDIGGSFDYEVNVPSEHPEGLFYYHPHMHGLTEFQIGNGMSGALIVAGLLDPFPDLSGITEHLMVLKDIQIVDGKVPNPPVSAQPTLRTLNGAVNPRVSIQPGELQLWRVANIGADIYYDIQLEGHTLYEIARDGNLKNQLVPQNHILLPTSARTEFLVRGGPPGEYAFATNPISMGPQGDTYPGVTLATMVSEGPEVPQIPLPQSFPEVPDLRSMPLCCSRTFDFSETPDGSQFCINNEQYDMESTNTTVQLGCVEEWTINNCAGENHVFHIHQLDFQVVEQNGQPVPFTGRQDTVNLDFRAADAGHPDRCQCDASGNCQNCTCPTPADPQGSVKILVPFTNPVIVGKFVYHCHIGEHEDNGMMQNIEVSETAGACEMGMPDSTMRDSQTPADRAVCNVSPMHMH
ncbi:MAG: multicopper oxidase family protein [Deltaproteobacteria bacterium]|nr:multicopper oxidase family protein [Deltaproteobacteria bacterium]